MADHDDEHFFAQAWERLSTFVQRQYPGFSREEGEDIVGEAMVRFVRYRREHDVREPLALLYRIVAGAASDAWKRRRSLGGEVGELILDRMAAPPPATEQDEPALAALMIHAWVAANRSEDCALLDLRCQGLSHREIGERLGLAPDVVRKRYSRLLGEIRRHATEIGIDRHWNSWTAGEDDA